MRTLSDNQPETYHVLGRKLFINYDIKEETVEDMDGSSRIQYSYYSALCDITSNRAERIEAIIATQYTTAQELATINNKASKPDEYQVYQDLRTLAKELADGYQT
nr:MAG: hypothetical protein [Caudoviricetes sp.]